MKRKAFYSVVQYCPDPARMECANVGIVLIVPDDGFVGVLMDPTLARVRRFFPDTDFIRLDAAVLAFTNGLRTQGPTKDAIQQWIDARANALRMTPLRAMAATCAPDVESECLFRELVAEP